MKTYYELPSKIRAFQWFGETTEDLDISIEPYEPKTRYDHDLGEVCPQCGYRFLKHGALITPKGGRGLICPYGFVCQSEQGEWFTLSEQAFKNKYMEKETP